MQPLYIIAHHCRPSARLLYREARNRANMRPQKAARGRAKATQEVEEVTIVAETQAQGEEAVVKKEKKVTRLQGGAVLPADEGPTPCALSHERI